MHGPRIRSTLGLLVLEFVQLRQDIDRNPDMIVVEPLDAVRVVEQNIGVEDEILAGDNLAARPGARFFSCRAVPRFKILEQARLLASYRNKGIKMLHEMKGLNEGMQATSWLQQTGPGQVARRMRSREKDRLSR